MQQLSRSAFIGIGLAAALFTEQAHAASKDAEAQELADQAIFTDYLQLDFAAGEKKLKRAIKVCEKRGACSPNVHAQVYRDLAVIYITGMKRPAEGKKLLVQALELDPGVALDADLTTPDLIRVFAEAKAEVEAAPDEEEDEEAAPAGAAPSAEEEPAAEAEGPASMDDPSVDCPPDFPGCDAPPEVDSAATEEEEPDQDLGIINWLSASLQQDFLMFSGESGVCGPDRPTELSCYRAGDAFRPGTEQNTAGDGGEVGGGFRPATTRLLLGYDRAMFIPNLTVGVRLGYAIGGGPAEPNGASFVPIHAELRGTYYFKPLEPRKVRPYATAGGGLAQIDSSVSTQVVDVCSPNGVTAGECPATAVGQIDTSTVTVWKKTGTTFASLGGGAMYPLSEHGGITAELKGMLLFPSSGMSISLQAGYTHGF